MAEKEKNNAVINTERNSESSVTEQEKNKPVNNSTDNEPFTDGRKKGEWKSRYPDTSAKVFHVSEALYLLVLYIASFALFILNYKGFIVDFLNISPDKVVICTRMFYCCIAGLLGGTVFTTKWFYRSIARGYWNIDRIYWRFFTPLISLVFAFALGCILKENILINKKIVQLHCTMSDFKMFIPRRKTMKSHIGKCGTDFLSKSSLFSFTY